MKVHCKTCDSMVPAEGVHSCYDAERVTRHREAERAVIEAAKVMAGVIYQPGMESHTEYKAAAHDLIAAVNTLRELEARS